MKTNKDRHILSAVQIFGRDSIVSGDIRSVRNSVGFSRKDSGAGHALTLV